MGAPMLGGTHAAANQNGLDECDDELRRDVNERADLGQVSHRARQGCIRRRLTATTLCIYITEFAYLSSEAASGVRQAQPPAQRRVSQ